MAVISLPLTFNNSFWTQDYRTGLDVIFKKLEQARLSCPREAVFLTDHLLSLLQGVAENDEIVTFIRVC